MAKGDKSKKARVSAPGATLASSSPLHFIELFAGKGVLTQAVLKLGIACEPPNDAAEGGTDFTSKPQVERLKAHLRVLRMSGKRLVIHLAPPCSTFSRARDRSSATRLRSTWHPAGFPWLDPERADMADEANQIAWLAFDFAVWAAKALDAVVSLENPSGSYIWPWSTLHAEFSESAFEDAVVSQCLFGAPYRKDTKFRLWNAKASALEHRCTKSAEGHTCGTHRHCVLAFDGLPTGHTGSAVGAPNLRVQKKTFE
jgi:site-specific DNA-cytosine methylase